MKLSYNSSLFLNLVRSASAQMVLIGHLLAQYEFYNPIKNQFIIQNFGVVLFFLISGFLITMSVDNKKNIFGYDFKIYFIERFSRIFIAYIPALFIILITDIIGANMSSYVEYNSSFDIKTFIGNIFMLQDFPLFDFLNNKLNIKYAITSFGSARQLWTVAIEWWMYLFFGILTLKKNNFYTFFILLLFISPVFINIGGRGNGLTILWFLGGLVYYILKAKSISISKNILLISVIILLFFFQRGRVTSWEVYDCGIFILIATLFYLILFNIQFNLPNNITNSNKIHNFINVTSDFSFSLYLLHYSLMIFIFKLSLNMNKKLELFLVFIFINIISWIFSRVTEKYHIQLRLKLQSLIR
jgi:peptidoglycan/LPS O-acetylase OafA/YrhL